MSYKEIRKLVIMTNRIIEVKEMITNIRNIISVIGEQADNL